MNNYYELVSSYHELQDINKLNRFLSSRLSELESDKDYISLLILSLLFEKENYFINATECQSDIVRNYKRVLTNCSNFDPGGKQYKKLSALINNITGLEDFKLETADDIIFLTFERLLNNLSELKIEDNIRKKWLSENFDEEFLAEFKEYIIESSSKYKIVPELFFNLKISNKKPLQEIRVFRTKDIIYNGIFLVIISAYFFLIGLDLFDFMSGETDIKIIPLPIFMFFIFVLPSMLIISWFYEAKRSKKTNTYHMLKNSGYDSENKKVIGVIVPFRIDYFHHIYQFIWIPFCFISMYLLWEFSSIGQNLTIFEKTSLSNLITNINDQISGEKFSISSIIHNNHIIFLISTCAALIGMIQQKGIQKNRIKNYFNIFWWDVRIDKLNYWLRLIFVGLTAFTMFYILLKLISVKLILDDILYSDNLQIQLFNSDYCGQGAIVDVFWLLLGSVFVFGILVVSGFYVHKKLLEYKRSALIYFVLYLGLSLFMLVLPLAKVYDNIDNTKTEEIALIHSVLYSETRNFGNIEETNNYLEYLEHIKGVNSSIISTDLLTSPFMILLLQFLYILWRFILYNEKHHIEDLTKNILISN